MQTAVYLLTGFPGVGKLTVARAMAERIEAGGETVRVVDNHWINNPIFGLVEQDGVTPLPRAVWDRVGEVAGAVLKTVEELTPGSWNVIFTAYVDGTTDIGYVSRVVEVADARGAVFVPVRILCDPDENARRIVAPGRRGRMKSVDAHEPYRLAELGPPFDSRHSNTLSLDVTAIEPGKAADVILDHRRTLARPATGA